MTIHPDIPDYLRGVELSLGARQELLAHLIPLLFAKAHEHNRAVRARELQRGAQQAAWNAVHCAKCRRHKNAYTHRSKRGHRFISLGIAHSVHLDSLAIDVYLRSLSTGTMLWSKSAYMFLGEYWKSLHPLCRWGGDFKRRSDAGHFSIIYNGRF